MNGEAPRRYFGGVMRTAIVAVFAAAFTISVSAQDFMAESGAPASAFPKPDHPVADIVSPIWHDEKERDDAGEPRQLVRLLGINSEMTIADCRPRPYVFPIFVQGFYFVTSAAKVLGLVSSRDQKPVHLL